jgi:hypothetical protein
MNSRTESLLILGSVELEDRPDSGRPQYVDHAAQLADTGAAGALD